MHKSARSSHSSPCPLLLRAVWIGSSSYVTDTTPMDLEAVKVAPIENHRYRHRRRRKKINLPRPTSMNCATVALFRRSQSTHAEHADLVGLQNAPYALQD